MEFIARIVEGGPPPSGEHLVLSDQELDGADFSGRKLHQLDVYGCRFRRCRFERMRVNAAFLGAGDLSEYVECSFDGSRFRHLGNGGFARFVRCSFHDIDFKHWICTAVEMVDCVFTGKLREVVLHSTVFDPWERERVHRERNEYHGNDFSGVTDFNVAFRTGIDLSQQRLPSGPDFLYLPDAARSVEAARYEISKWEPADRSEAEWKLERYAKDIAGGQRQLLIRRSDLLHSKIPKLARIAPALLQVLEAVA